MASTGIRQLGIPRINLFADRQRPEPFHLEVNNWEHTLNLLYRHCIQRNVVDKLVDILKTAVGQGGCVLKNVAANILEHYKDDKKRFNKLSNRLIGSQAILLAKCSLRAVDVLKIENGSELEKLYRCATSTFFESLRHAGVLANRVTVDNTYPKAISEICTLYFNLYAMFFSEDCNSTVWTLGYVVPYHAKKLYQSHSIGYGILSMQGKEAKHSQIKHELKNCSNRQIEGDKNKWYQLMQSSYVRTFYLPYHYPMKTYTPHFQSRNPNPSSESVCICYRTTNNNALLCDTCEYIEPYMNEITIGKMSSEIVKLIKPLECTLCNIRFPDIIIMPRHKCMNNCAMNSTSIDINPWDLSARAR